MKISYVCTAAVLLLLVAGCGGIRQSGKTTNGGAKSFSHVFVVVLENHGYAAVSGNAAMPFLNSLMSQDALATNYFANSHPSIGNYFMMTTGQLITTDDSFGGTVSADNVVRELNKAGKSWKVYAESLPSPGYLGGDVFPYAKHHNPFAFFSDVRGSASQAANLVPFTQLASDLGSGSLPNYGFIIPNLQDDAHDCPAGMTTCTDADMLAAADNWLKNNIGPLLANGEFQNSGLLIVTWDEAEDSDTAHGGGHVVTVVAGGKAGAQSSRLYQHQSLLATTLSVLGVSARPGASKGAPVIDDLF